MVLHGIEKVPHLRLLEPFLGQLLSSRVHVIFQARDVCVVRVRLQAILAQFVPCVVTNGKVGYVSNTINSELFTAAEGGFWTDLHSGPSTRTSQTCRVPHP